MTVIYVILLKVLSRPSGDEIRKIIDVYISGEKVTRPIFEVGTASSVTPIYHL
jgi:hypothetical protein